MMSPALLAFAAAPRSAEDGSVSALVWRAGDAALVRRVLAETGAHATPAGPRIGDYFAALIDAAMRALGSSFAAFFSGAGGVVSFLPLAALLIAFLAALLLLFFVVRRILGRRRRGFVRSSASRVESGEAVPRLRDAAAWRHEVETRIARGDVAAALEALWWWLADSLSIGVPVDSSWTTRELLGRAARRDLVRVGGELDGLLYGPRRPTASDVISALARFEKAIG